MLDRSRSLYQNRHQKCCSSDIVGHNTKSPDWPRVIKSVKNKIQKAIHEVLKKFRFRHLYELSRIIDFSCLRVLWWKFGVTSVFFAPNFLSYSILQWYIKKYLPFWLKSQFTSREPNRWLSNPVRYCQLISRGHDSRMKAGWSHTTTTGQCSFHFVKISKNRPRILE